MRLRLLALHFTVALLCCAHFANAGSDTPDPDQLDQNTDYCVNSLDGIPCGDCCDNEGGPGAGDAPGSGNGPGASGGEGPRVGGSTGTGFLPGDSSGGGAGSESCSSGDPGDLDDFTKMSAGNPIDPGHKTKVGAYTDILIPLSGGLNFHVQRLYSSGRLANTSITGSSGPYYPMFGNSWHSNIDPRIFRESGSQAVIVMLPNSRPRIFYWDAGLNRWQSSRQQGYLAYMTYDSSSKRYTLVFPSKHSFVFNERGRLVAKINPSGDTLTYVRELVSAGGVTIDRLSSIDAPAHDGRKLKFDYVAGQPHLVSRIRLLTTQNPAYNKELVSYTYHTNALHLNLLSRVLYMGEGRGTYYKYGSWDAGANGGQGGITDLGRSWIRTLAEVGSYSTATGERPLGRYTYRNGGLQEFAGWDGTEPWKEYRASYQSSAPESVAAWNLLFTFSSADTSYDRASSHYDYYTRVYRGAWGTSGPYSQYRSDPYSRMQSESSHSSGYAALNTSSFWDNNRMLVTASLEWGNPSKKLWNRVYPAWNDYSPAQHLSWNNITAQEDGLGRKTSFVYDQTWNMPTQITNAYGQVTTIAYSPTHGQPTQITNPAGHVEQFEYNSYGNLKRITTSHSGETTCAYYSHGYRGTVHPNNPGMLAAKQSPDGQLVTYVYDEMSHLVRTTSNDGPPVFNTYQGDTLVATGDGNSTTTYQIDSLGRRSVITDPRGATTSLFYDGLNRVVKVTDRSGGNYHINYGVHNNVASVTDPSGLSTSFGYDDAGRLIRETDANNASVYYQYGSAGCGSCGGGGHLTQVTDRKGQVTVYEYDSSERLQYVKYFSLINPVANNQPNRTVTYSYLTETVNGASVPTTRISMITDSALPFTSKSYQYQYDSLGGLLKRIHPDGYEEEFFYDSARRIEARRGVDGGITTYQYDAKSRLTSMTNPLNGVTQFRYVDGNGELGHRSVLSRLTLSNGVYTDYHYDAQSRLASVANYNPLNALLSRLDYDYDENNNVVRIETPVESGAWEYEYDPMDRLTKEIRKDNYGNSQWYLDYDYDSVGNRLQRTWHNGLQALTATYTYNNLKQLVGRSGGGEPTRSGGQYDANGNQVFYMEGGEEYQMNWDLADRLSYVQTHDDMFKTWFGYDFMGSRILRRAADGSRRRYYFKRTAEEVVKLAVPGSADDKAFEFVTKNTGAFVSSQWYVPASGVSSVYDALRRSDVIRLAGNTWAMNGKDYRGGGAAYDYAVTGKKTVSLWARSAGDCELIVTVQSNAQLRGLRYCLFSTSDDSTPFLYFNNLAVFGSSLSADDKWHRLDRNLAADLAAAFPGETLVSIKGITVATYSASPLYLDDVRFSNCQTVIENTVGPRAVGNVLQQRTINPVNYTKADSWFQHDKVGSVLAVTNASGAQTARYWQDAYGNLLSSAVTGQPASASAMEGRHFQGKEYDSEAGLYYFGLRWYDPGVGRFISEDPAGTIDGPNLYQMVKGNPVNLIDPTGGCSSKPARPGQAVNGDKPGDDCSKSPAVGAYNSSTTAQADCLAEAGKQRIAASAKSCVDDLCNGKSSVPITCRGNCPSGGNNCACQAGKESNWTPGFDSVVESHPGGRISLCVDQLKTATYGQVMHDVVYEFRHACGDMSNY